MPERKPENPARTVAELERQLAQARAERDEALAQQTAMAEVLGVINSSPGDLAPVFDAILEKAMSLCSAAMGFMTTYDGERFASAAMRDVPEQLAAYFAGGIDHPQPGESHWRLLQGEDLVHNLDQKDEDAYRSGSPFRRAVVDLGGTRTALVVALRKDGRLLGTLTLYRKEVSPFTDTQIALVQNFAAQAVIAMENARLITETREALDQQTATAEVLQVINSSPGELAPVFEAMLDKAINLCEATFGTLWTYDGEFMNAAAVQGAAPRYTEFLRAGPHRPSPIGHLPLLQGAPVVHLADVSAHEGYRSSEALPNALVDLGGVRALLAVPLRKDAELLGVFSIYRDEVRTFTDKQIALLQNFAAQAVIAMENARLLTETREALDQQTATAEVLQVINSSPGELAPVFEAILEKAHLLCGAAHGVLVLREGENFRVVVARGLPEAFAERLKKGFPGAGNPVAEPLLAGAPLIQIADLRQIGHPLTQAGGTAGLRTLMAVALRKDGVLLGWIVAARREIRTFSEKEVALLQNFAAQAVVAMENARLLTETREALEQQTATAEVLQVINASPGDLAPVFDAILERAHSLCDIAQGSLELYDGERFRAVAVRGLTNDFADTLRGGYLASDNPATRPLIEGSRFTYIPDMAKTDYPITRISAETEAIRTLLCVPLRRDDRLLGMIASARREVRPFSDKEIALLENFAAQAVIAMESARLLGELRERTEEVAQLNRGLEARVAAQLDELGRVGRLKQFLAPQLAELVVSQGDESILESHRREIVVVFCDMRGYTGFSETAEPEEVIEVLREYHAALGPLVAQFEGTLDQFSGDGIMVFFNDPLPCPDPAARAVGMAQAMREAAAGLMAAWRRRGHQIGFGVGIAQGYATLGQIGFAERVTYTAIGTVCNLAARLCGEAQDGQILISQRVATAVEEIVALEEIGNLALKGLSQAVAVYNVVRAA